MPRHTCAHRVHVILDDIDDWQIPERRHVECFVDLPLIGGAVPEICKGNVVRSAIFVGESKAGANRNLSSNDPMASIEILFLGKHVHRSALPFGKPADATCKFRHHTTWVHVACQHVTMIAIPCDDLVAILQTGLHARHDRFLANVKVTEASNLAHAVELSGFFLKPAYQEHGPIIFQHLRLAGL